MSAGFQQGWFVHSGSDGTLTVVDARGNPIADPPIVSSHAPGEYYGFLPAAVEQDAGECAVRGMSWVVLG